MIGKSRSSRYLVENLICFWATDQYAKKLTFLWNTVEVEFLSMKVVADAIFVYHFIFRFVSCVEKFSEHLGIFLKVVNCSRFRMEIFMLPLTQTSPPHSTQLGSLAFPMSSTLFVHTKVHLLTSIRIYMYLGTTSVSLVTGSSAAFAISAIASVLRGWRKIDLRSSTRRWVGVVSKNVLRAFLLLACVAGRRQPVKNVKVTLRASS